MAWQLLSTFYIHEIPPFMYAWYVMKDSNPNEIALYTILSIIDCFTNFQKYIMWTSTSKQTLASNIGVRGNLGDRVPKLK